MVKHMPYCPKCGVEVKEEMEFCPQCGASLKPLPARVKMEKEEKEEKEEKREKREKAEKGEKHEKREVGYVGPLVGGLILILVGITFFLAATERIQVLNWGPIFLIMVGIIILIFGLYATLIAAKRSPRPP
jgi:uncharacterized membrane protein YvbJ